MILQYLYSAEAENKERHESILALLAALERGERIASAVVRDHREMFSTDEARAALLDQLRDFGVRHHVKLGKLFGSNRHRFSWLPPEFLLVYEGSALREVFPCEVEGNVIEVPEFLQRLRRGEAWTIRSARARREGGRHRELVEAIVRNPDALEPGLKLPGSNVHVSRGFGESGYIDLVFTREDGSYLLVEVKVQPEEIDKAIGQIMRHRELFTVQNALDKSRVSMAIACPFISPHSRLVCQSAGIVCFQLGSHATS